jgi:hypothetical protein
MAYVRPDPVELARPIAVPMRETRMLALAPEDLFVLIGGNSIDALVVAERLSRLAGISHYEEKGLPTFGLIYVYIGCAGRRDIVSRFQHLTLNAPLHVSSALLSELLSAKQPPPLTESSIQLTSHVEAHSLERLGDFQWSLGACNQFYSPSGGQAATMLLWLTSLQALR